MTEARKPPQNPILLIPARMQAARLPNKPLADIGGTPMIVHVLRRATESGLGRVVVAAAEQEIVDAVTQAGGEAVLTNPALPSGSDRIHEALSKIDAAHKHDAVINVQGDVPTLEGEYIRAAYSVLSNPDVDIGTLVTPLTRDADIDAPQNPKVILDIKENEQVGRAFYFTRVRAPYGQGPYYGHIGLYAYRREALERFVKSPQNGLEKRESLEQLRALGLGLRIDARVVDTFPLGVDTPENLEQVRMEMKKREHNHG